MMKINFSKEAVTGLGPLPPHTGSEDRPRRKRRSRMTRSRKRRRRRKSRRRRRREEEFWDGLVGMREV